MIFSVLFGASLILLRIALGPEPYVPPVACTDISTEFVANAPVIVPTR